MKEKYKAAYLNRSSHSKSQYLNSESFYEEMGIQERWVRLEQSIEEIIAI